MSKSLIPYCGGKVMKMKEINALIKEHYKPKVKQCFVDAFGGGGNVAFNVDKSLFALIVYNDLDNGIYNLIKQIRDNVDELMEALSLTPYSRTEFYESKYNLDEPGISDLERARRRYVFIMQSMFNFGKDFRTPTFGSGNNRSYKQYFNKIKLLKDISLEINQWYLENRDGLEVAKRFSECRNSLVFLDPPYLGESNKQYYKKSDDSLEFFKSIVDFANNAKCNIIICNYDNGFYDEHLEGFTKQCDERKINSSIKKETEIRSIKKDCLWYRFN